ncbi:MAG TPA: hypothetical protein VFM37_05275 [Pseudonocardiaceae bacterium]|nr:hypothetical protein [Pseudonocardiaceae bacterium]
MFEVQSPKRALLGGLGVWVGLVAISLILLPAEGKHEALYESIKLSTLVGVTIALTIWYLRAVRAGSFVEGLVVGLVWAAITIIADLALYFAGAFNISLTEYFTDVASSYLAIPIATTLVVGFLQPRTTPVASLEQPQRG